MTNREVRNGAEWRDETREFDVPREPAPPAGEGDVALAGFPSSVPRKAIQGRSNETLNQLRAEFFAECDAHLNSSASGPASFL